MNGLFSLQTAALPMALSGLLHIFAFVVAGFTAFSGLMLGIGIAYCLAAIGLRRQWRWLAWLAFLVMLAGAVGAYVISGDAGLKGWWFLAIAIVDAVAAAILFGALWKSRPAIT